MTIFLSYILDEKTPSYGNRDKFSITTNSQIIDGTGANTSTWNFSNNHMGTHMDSPHHFFNDGKKTSNYSAEDFCFDHVFILEKKCDYGELILLGPNEINKISIKTDFLIIKTGYCNFRSSKKYYNDNPGLKSDLANILKEKLPNLKGIGFDFISLTSWNHRDHGKISHKSFLGEPNNFLIIEDMDLLELEKSTNIKSLIVAPLRTIDGNGGPVTIIADIDEK